MVKSGIIVGAIGFIYLFVTNITMMPCTPFEAVVLGICAGVLAAVFDKPRAAQKAAVSGAIAGSIAAILSVIGNTIGYLIRVYVIFSPRTFVSNLTQLTGAQYSSGETTLGVLAPLCCCFITDLVLIVGLGALSGYLWFAYKNKKAAPPPPQAIS
jgi:hypothetical protein